MLTKAALLLWLFIDDCIVNGMQFQRHQLESFQPAIRQSDIAQPVGRLYGIQNFRRNYQPSSRADSRVGIAMRGIVGERENPDAREIGNSPISQNRRFYWEPIVDGNVISSIGSLFSQKIKDESNRERKEREKIRENELLEKYTKMLNDPEQLKELQKQSANAPKYIHQVV